MKASEIVRNMFIKNGREVVITTLTGINHIVTLNKDDRLCCPSGLRKQELSFSVFDTVVDFLRENGGRARKGCGHNKADKVGYGNCTLDTVCGQIATKYYGHRIGESTFDPVFIVCSILEQAGICENQRGYIKLKVKK